MTKIHIRKKDEDPLLFILDQFIETHEAHTEIYKKEIECARDILRKIVIKQHHDDFKRKTA